jgi:hypothetical protein
MTGDLLRFLSTASFATIANDRHDKQMAESRFLCAYCGEPLHATTDSLTGWRHTADGQITCANKWGLASPKPSTAVDIAAASRRALLSWGYLDPKD